MSPQRNSKTAYFVFAIAIIMMLLGLVVNVIYFDYFALRTVGIILLVVGAFLVKGSKISSSKLTRFSDNTKASSSVNNYPGKLAWVISLASVVALIVSYIFMWQDARDGGREAWPADAFAASALFAAAAWGYLVASYVTNKK